jgi:hypothetical protein
MQTIFATRFIVGDMDRLYIASIGIAIYNAGIVVHDKNTLDVSSIRR